MSQRLQLQLLPYFLFLFAGRAKEIDLFFFVFFCRQVLVTKYFNKY